MQDDANIDAPETGIVETEANESTLDNLLDQAIAAHNEPTPDDQSTERSRDERGRFASQGNEPAKASDPAPVQTPPVLDPAPQAQPVEAPARWNADDKAAFEALPHDAKERLLRLNKGMEADYTRKTQEAAEIRRHAEPLLQAVSPFNEYLTAVGQQLGAQPAQLVHNLIATEYMLRTGTPEQKAAALAKIAASYGIAPQPMGTADGQQPQATQPDPYVNHLYQQFPAIDSRLARLEQTDSQYQNERIALQVESFQTAKGPDGQLKHPYFEDVRPHMAALMQSGQAQTMEEAYEIAAAPIVRHLQSSQSVRQEAEEKARREAIEKAQRAAPVRAGGSAPRGVSHTSDLDALLDQQLSKAGYA